MNNNKKCVFTPHRNKSKNNRLEYSVHRDGKWDLHNWCKSKDRDYVISEMLKEGYVVEIHPYVREEKKFKLKRVLGENVEVGTKIIDRLKGYVYDVMWHDKDARDNLVQVGVTISNNKNTSIIPLDGELLENDIFNEDAVGDEALRFMIREEVSNG